MLNPDQAEVTGQSLAPPYWCAIILWTLQQVRLWLQSPGVPGNNASVWVPRLLCTLPPLGDGARGPGMQTKGVTDQETHLEKPKLLFSVEPVGDTQLIGISGFL